MTAVTGRAADEVREPHVASTSGPGTAGAQSSEADPGDGAADPASRPRRRWHGVVRPTTQLAAVTTSGDAVQQTAMAVRSLTISVNRFRAAVADALEISPTDVLALTEVALTPGLTPGELAERIGVGIAGTSSVIDRVVRAGFLRREPAPLDRRTYNLVLSPAGRHAVGWITDATRAAITDAHAHTTVSRSTEVNSDIAAGGAAQTIAQLAALSDAYYRHADTVSAS